MSELNYPNATKELAQLLGVEGKEEQIDEFLSKWAVMTTQKFTSFLPHTYSSQEILDGTDDVYKPGYVMEYGFGEEDEEDEEDEEESDDESTAEPAS